MTITTFKGPVRSQGGFISGAGTSLNVVIAETNPLTGGSIKTIWNGTQAQYDAIAVKDDSTLYVIVG